MASGEAEPLQYTTTVLRVSIHCEGCKKKVKKVLQSIEGVYKVTVDAAQHKVTVTGSVGADALIRRLNKAGKQAALWPVPAPAAEAKKEVAAAALTAGGEDCKDAVADKAGAKPKEAAKEKGAEKQQAQAEGSLKKPVNENKGSEKDKCSPDKKSEKAEAAKQKDDGEKENEAKETKGSPPQQPAEEASGGEESGSAKKGSGKKKKNKQPKDCEGQKKPSPQQPVQAPAAAPPPQLVGPERPHGGAFPFYAPQPVMSYNVAHPSASVSYYAPTPSVPMPPQVPYGYPPYPGMMPPLPEYMYGPPGMRSSPPQESYNNMFNEENANSCSLM